MGPVNRAWMPGVPHPKARDYWKAKSKILIGPVFGERVSFAAIASVDQHEKAGSSSNKSPSPQPSPLKGEG